MHFSIHQSLEILERTPDTLANLLTGLSTDWTANNEGPDTWSVYDVMGHLIHNDQANWPVRIALILSNTPEKKFEPLDRFAQLEASRGKSLPQLLEAFKQVRVVSVHQLRKLEISDEDLMKTGTHPAFGEVTLYRN